MGKRQVGREKDGEEGETGRTEKGPPRYRQTEGITGKDRLGQSSLESPQDRDKSLWSLLSGDAAFVNMVRHKKDLPESEGNLHLIREWGIKF